MHQNKTKSGAQGQKTSIFKVNLALAAPYVGQQPTQHARYYCILRT